MKPPERFPPDDPREWLNRAKGNLARAKAPVPGGSAAPAARRCGIEQGGARLPAGELLFGPCGPAAGTQAMGREEAAYWLGMAMHRKHPRRVLTALRFLLTAPRR